MTYRTRRSRGNASELKRHGISAMRMGRLKPRSRRGAAAYAARMRGCSSRSMDGISLSGFGRLNR